MSDNTVPTKTLDDASEDDKDKIDEPTNTKHVNTNNETVIQIEDNVEDQEDTTVEQLKQAVFKDQGLHSVYVIAGKGKKHQTQRQRNDGDRYSNRQIWVQAMRGEASGAEMADSSRGPFIRKVFAILFFCMLFTCIFAAMTFFMPEIRLYFKSPAGAALGLFAMLVLVPINYAMVCSDCTRVPPCNFICLVIVVVCFTTMFGFITARYSLRIVFMALLVTTLVVLLCFCLAFTGFDFTKFYIYVVVIMFVLFAFSIVVFVMMLVFHQKFTGLRLLICFGMTLLQSIMFIMELQMVIGGKTIELGEDDYVLGAYMLYTSIIELFFQILRLLALLEELDI